MSDLRYTNKLYNLLYNITRRPMGLIEQLVVKLVRMLEFGSKLILDIRAILYVNTFQVI